MPLFRSLTLLLLALSVLANPALAEKKQRVTLEYQVSFLPQSGEAAVSLRLAENAALISLLFDLGDKGYYSDFKGTGTLSEQAGQMLWTPGKGTGKGALSYRVKIDHPRDNGRFDARITPDWALLRGDDLIPSAKVVHESTIELQTYLQFELPPTWKSVETGWPRVGKNRFRINNPSRKFDRPTGWIIAGKIGSRRDQLGDASVSVAAPIGEGMRRMDILTLLSFVWPQAQEAFQRQPAKLLVVGANDPMWRGGLSAPNSLFMHAARPLVSENGTSSLVHELTHVFTRIRDRDNSDWISEGLAEFYAIELVRRAGGMSEYRYQAIRSKLQTWSKGVKTLRGSSSSGPVTARAVLLLQELDQEIREQTGNQRSLDDVTRGLMRLETASTKDFIDISENILGRSSAVLDTRLLK
ncbi:hypothetical protein [Pseudomonas sp. N040]|uniref:hypothetical protein n=1 Tax=Pseudomonas sp. N040 TaxID=2785325 RepID=UPI0018A30397|nr:hypothetical protein [Pseudomonas sp. N040]MBF7729434.1 hypothetical protein [Pseudomonas sp. N040]MBW7013074.1 hypothetical protein [Pseudomonas sp. N040]